jgi:hypothetical protein
MKSRKRKKMNLKEEMNHTKAAHAKLLVTMLLMAWIIGIGTINPSTIKAQSSISGYVLNAANSNPISGAHLTLNNTVRATSQPPNGFFRIHNLKPGSKITISHVGFEKKTVVISDTVHHIYLVPRINQLPTVNINDKPYINIIKDKKMYVIDYAFVGNQLLAISLDNRRIKESKVVLITPNGDTMKSTEVDNPEELFEDCFHNHHLLTPAIAHQIYIDSNRIHMIYPNARKHLEQAFQHVVGHYKGTFILRYDMYDNQIVRFSLFDTSTKTESILCEVMDEGGLERLGDKSRLQSMKGYTQDDARFEEMCFYAKKELFTFMEDSLIYLFNTMSKQIEVYTLKGDLIRSTDMDFHEDKNWDKRIIRDDVNGSYYTLFTKNGITTLYPIVLASGKLGDGIEIPGINFAQKIQVNDGRIYFLYNDRSNGNYKQLYAMNVDL